MKALIIASGKIKDYNLLKSLVQKSDFILCADGGINHLMKLGVIPNLVLGDLDSISESGMHYIRYNNIKVEKHPVMKDETDTHLAVNYAISKGYRELTIIGGIGSRIDHSLANIYLLRTINKNGIKGRIINENNIIHLVDKKIILSKKENYFTSIIPISLSGIHISISGFLYPLNDQYIEFASTRGVSNQVTEDYGIIKIHDGEALVIESKDM